MNEGDIVQLGRPRELYFRPKTQFVGNLVGAANLLPGRVISVDEADGDDGVPVVRAATFETALGPVRVTDPSVEQLRVGAECSVLVRPESVVLHTENPERENVFIGRVELALFVGEAVDHEVSVGEVLLNARAASVTRFRREEKVFVELPASSCVVFAE
jgi:iron(III) transport system ATP-binding protein